MAPVCDPQGSLRTRSVRWVRSQAPPPSFAVCNCTLSHHTRLYLPLSLTVRNVNTLRTSAGPSLSITSVNAAQQSQGTRLKGHSRRVSGCSSGRKHHLKGNSMSLYLPGQRLAGGLVTARSLRTCHPTRGSIQEVLLISHWEGDHKQL